MDGTDIRARVIGEGANLAITQAGRIEYARAGAGGEGGRINTDALDNSAGVSTSDHEVNIKILTTDAERSGALTRPQRNELLTAMTDEVAALVLNDNHEQSLAVSLELVDGRLRPAVPRRADAAAGSRRPTGPPGGGPARPGGAASPPDRWRGAGPARGPQRCCRWPSCG